MPNSPIFILTGTSGAGKTTVARHLLQRFAFGLHIPMDDLREWVVSGIAHPIPEWTDETTRQFQLAYRAAAKTARLYSQEGFAVVIEQIIYPHFVREILMPELAGHTLHKVFLQPRVEVARERNASRTNKDFDTAVLDEPLVAMQQSLSEDIEKDGGWIVIDNSDLTVEETVDAILLSVGIQ